MQLSGACLDSSAVVYKSSVGAWGMFYTCAASAEQEFRTCSVWTSGALSRCTLRVEREPSRLWKWLWIVPCATLLDDKSVSPFTAVAQRCFRTGDFGNAETWTWSICYGEELISGQERPARCAAAAPYASWCCLVPSMSRSRHFLPAQVFVRSGQYRSNFSRIKRCFVRELVDNVLVAIQHKTSW